MMIWLYCLYLSLIVVCFVDADIANQQAKPKGKTTVSPSPAPTDSTSDGNIDAAPTQVNVVLIIVDDLRNEVGPYLNSGHPMYGKPYTPNFDMLAENGVTFTRSYVQLTSCNPSRNSFLTGLRPADLQLYNKNSIQGTPAWGQGKVQTITSYFKGYGYSVYGVGKIYHQEMPGEFDKYVKLDNQNDLCGSVFWCIKPESLLVDSWVAGQSDGILATHKRTRTNPFFLIAGFHRPHYMLSFPQWALSDVPRTTISDYLTNSNGDWQVYGGAVKANPNINDIPLIANIQASKGNGAQMPVSDVANHKTYCMAAIHWVDKTIGSLLQSISNNGYWSNTVIAVIGDHGLSLGEHSAIGKSTLFEHVSRAPFILSVPWLPKSHGRRSGTVVEFIDIFPTLVGAAGIPFNIGGNKIPLLGTNLMPFVNILGTSKITSSGLPEAEIVMKSYAVTEDGRCSPNGGGFRACEVLDLATAQVDVLGLSIRTKRWRYTEWRYTTQSGRTEAIWTSDGLFATELYDHLNDDGTLSTDAAKFEHQNLFPCGDCFRVQGRRSLSEEESSKYKVQMKLGNDLETEDYDVPRRRTLLDAYSIAVAQLSFLMRAVVRDRIYPCDGHGLPTVTSGGEATTSKCICDYGWTGLDCSIAVIPAMDPGAAPTTKSPTLKPTTSKPTKAPRTKSPTTKKPSMVPTEAPTTKKPTTTPTESPTNIGDTRSPSANPTNRPSTRYPTASMQLNPNCVYGKTPNLCGAVPLPCLPFETGDDALDICKRLGGRTCTVKEIATGTGIGAAPKACKMDLVWAYVKCSTNDNIPGFRVTSIKKAKPTSSPVQSPILQNNSTIVDGDCVARGDPTKLLGVLCCMTRLQG